MITRFQILSLDGGGIKGIFSAAILAFLEEDLNLTISDHFDLIVGTSTGGIIALCLGIGMNPREVVKFYIEKGPRIFPAKAGSKVRQVFASKYNPTQLQEALRECLGEKRLADSKKRLVIPSYNIGEDDVYLFKTPHHEHLKRDYRVPMWKVGMATSSAPTYLPTFKGVDGVRLVDGGIWANNPTMVGIIEAYSMLDVPLSAMRVFSLGTTNGVKHRAKKLDRGGIWQWKNDATDIILRGQSIGSFRQAQHLIGKDSIIRLDPLVPDGLFELDKLSEEDLLAKAAHESRTVSPGFSKMFCNYHAPEFTPKYK